MRKVILWVWVLALPWICAGCVLQDMVDSPEAQVAVTAAVAPSGFGWAVPLLMNGLSALVGWGSSKLSHNKTVKTAQVLIDTNIEVLKTEYPEIYAKIKLKAAEKAHAAGAAVGARLYRIVKGVKGEKV